jgi:hypothetical protein
VLISRLRLDDLQGENNLRGQAIIVVVRSANQRNHRGAINDNATVIDWPIPRNHVKRVIDCAHVDYGQAKDHGDDKSWIVPK